MSQRFSGISAIISLIITNKGKNKTYRLGRIIFSYENLPREGETYINNNKNE